MIAGRVESPQTKGVRQVEAQKMRVVSGVILLGLICVAVGAFYFLGLKLLHLSVGVFFSSFLLLWHWATVEKGKFSGLPASLLGALIGLGLAWQSIYFIGHFGVPSGLVMALIPILVALFLVIMNWVPIAFNSSAMLFLTVRGAPALASSVNFGELSKAVVSGALFFAAVVYLAKLSADARNKSKAADKNSGATRRL